MRLGTDPEDTPDFVAARDHVLESLLAFTNALRAGGATVPANAAIDAARALVEVGFDDRDTVRYALRAALINRSEDLPAFERLFPKFWDRLNAGSAALDAESPYEDVPGGLATPEAIGGTEDTDPPEESDGDSEDDGEGLEAVETAVSPAGGEDREPESDEEAETSAVYSPSGRSEPVSATLPMVGREDELAAPMRHLTDALAELQGRRWGRQGDHRVDVRRALRGSFGTGGTVVSVPTHDRQRSAVKATLLVDVSQSVLDTIDRGFLLRFLRRASDAWRTVRIFFFDTSVREVTEAFRQPTPRAALSALERAEAEWGGGTRIGRAIDEVRRHHPDAIDRSTATFVVSDGLEVGQLELLEAGMSWLSARSPAVIWCNPLAASAEYEPTCRGMAAALPYVDGLFAFAGPEDVEEMARQLARQGPGGTIGYEHDARSRG